MIKKYLSTVIIIIVAFSLSFRGIYWVYHDTNLSIKSLNWEKSTAIIIKHDLSKYLRGRQYSLRIYYSYIVNGKEYINDQLGYPRIKYTKLMADNKFQEYPLFTTVDVYYDSKDPNKSCLEPGGIDYFFIIMISFVSLLFFFLGTFLIYHIFKHYKHNN
ncbi:DUF3592 domain-containing protein [Patescibacteria group bacterium]|nr:DUF3592 domain-containing protein [Patescibacteria group bacterium]MBU1721442.1 DUF3592 domain-containing protein [Patescibacteria group bacterium]MBU1901306.1 DUF3592 domain-containing protein [Patescibacteria group bacterium]